MVGVDSNSTGPVKCSKVPSEGTADGGNVDMPRGGGVAEVGKAKVEEVDDEQQLGEPKVAADPEVDEAEEEEVVCYKVRANVGSSIDVDGVGGVEGPRVAELQDEEGDPVDASDNLALGEGGEVVVLPEAAMGFVALVGLVEGVVEGGEEQDEVGDGGGYFVEEDGLGGEFVAAGEGIEAVGVGRGGFRHGGGGGGGGDGAVKV